MTVVYKGIESEENRQNGDEIDNVFHQYHM